MADDVRLAERRGYSRGYNAGYRRKWPAHLPPIPPQEVVADLMRAAIELRNRADGLIATGDYEDDGPFEQRLGPGIDAVDAALIRLSRWLKSQERSDG